LVEADPSLAYCLAFRHNPHPFGSEGSAIVYIYEPTGFGHVEQMTIGRFVAQNANPLTGRPEVPKSFSVSDESGARSLSWRGFWQKQAPANPGDLGPRDPAARP
jgi:hypothetical protein